MSSSTQSLRRLLVTAAVTGAVIGLPALILQRWVAGTRGAAILMVLAWFVICAVALLAVLRRRPGLRLAAGGTYLLILVGTVAVGYWTGFRDSVVSEEIAVAQVQASGMDRERGLAGDAGAGARSQESGPIELASGRFEGADGHAGSGRAAVVQQPGGERLLTFSDFDVDPGVDVDVFLVPGDGSDVSDRVELGNLKGNVGDQQYRIPDGTDLTRYGTVVLWCNPFTVRIAVARLQT